DESCDVLSSEGRRSDSVAVWPAIGVESPEKRLDGIIASPMSELTARTVGRHRFRVNREPAQKRIRKCEEQKKNSHPDAQPYAKDRSENASSFALPPRRSPEKGCGDNERVNDSPGKRSARSGEDHSGCDKWDRQKAEQTAFGVTQERVANKSQRNKPSHVQQIHVPAGANEHGRRSIYDDTGYGSDPIEIAELPNILLHNGGVQECRTHNRLSYAKTGY